MATRKSSGNAGRRTTSPTKQTKSATKTPSPTAMATRVKPVRTVPTGPIVHSKTLANGEPRPKSRRSR